MKWEWKRSSTDWYPRPGQTTMLRQDQMEKWTDWSVHTKKKIKDEGGYINGYSMDSLVGIEWQHFSDFKYT